VIDEEKVNCFLETRLNVASILDYAEFTTRTGRQLSTTNDEMIGVTHHDDLTPLRRDDVICMIPTALKRKEIVELDNSDELKFATLEERDALMKKRKILMEEVNKEWEAFLQTYKARHKKELETK